MHLLSRVSEIGDFNYVTLLDGKSPNGKEPELVACNPQILLTEKNGEIVLEVMTVVLDPAGGVAPKGISRGRSPKKKLIKNMEITSNVLPRDRWIHCAVHVREIADRGSESEKLSAESKSKTKSKGKIIKEKTVLQLLLDGKMVKTAETESGRPPVFQNTIIGCIPSRLHLLFSDEEKDKDRDRERERERDSGGSIGPTSDTNKTEKTKDTDSRNENMIKNNKNEATEFKASNKNATLSKGPIIADVYWLPSLPSVPSGTPGLRTQSTEENESLWGIFQALDPPSAWYQSSPSALSASTVILESATSLLLSDMSTTSLLNPNPRENNEITESLPGHDVLLGERVAAICLFAFDLIACGNQKVIEKSFHILRTIVESLNFQDMKLDAKSSTSVAAVTSSIRIFLDCLMDFVCILIDPCAGDYFTLFPRTHPEDEDFRKKSSNDKSVALSENIKSVTLLWAQRVCVDSKNLERELRAPSWSSLTSLDSISFLSGVASVVSSALTAGIIDKSFLYRENNHENNEYEGIKKTKKAYEVYEVRRKKTNASRQLIAAICGGGLPPEPGLFRTVDLTPSTIFSPNSCQNSQSNGSVNKSNENRKMSFPSSATVVDKSQTSNGLRVRNSGVSGVRSDLTGLIFGVSEMVTAQDAFPILKLNNIVPEKEKKIIRNYSGEEKNKGKKNEFFSFPNIEELLLLLQKTLSPNSDLPQGRPLNSKVTSTPENQVLEEKFDLVQKSEILQEISLQLARVRCVLVQMAVVESDEKFPIIYNERIRDRKRIKIENEIENGDGDENKGNVENEVNECEKEKEKENKRDSDLTILGRILESSMASLLSLSSSDALQCMQVLNKNTSAKDITEIFNRILQEGDINFIEKVYVRLWKSVRAPSAHTLSTDFTPVAETLYPEFDKNSVESEFCTSSPILKKESVKINTDMTKNGNEKGSVKIDWYHGTKGDDTCPIVVLGGDVQITDGTKVRASLHFSSVSSSPLIAINLDHMTGRWFYEVSTNRTCCAVL
jgi:hypothetical protein